MQLGSLPSAPRVLCGGFLGCCQFLWPFSGAARELLFGAWNNQNGFQSSMPMAVLISWEATVGPEVPTHNGRMDSEGGTASGGKGKTHRSSYLLDAELVGGSMPGSTAVGRGADPIRDGFGRALCPNPLLC